MSEETKKDLQRQIDEEENTITACNARAADLRKALSLIKDKPEPRQGDYGCGSGGFSRVCVRTSGTKNVIGASLGDTMYPISSEGYTWQGNIFDDLKAAGPDGILLPLTREEAESLLRNGRYKGYHNVDAKIKAKLKQHHEQVD